MSKVRVTVEKDGESRSFEGEFAVVGMVTDEGSEKVSTVATLGSTTAYSASMMGC